MVKYMADTNCNLLLKVFPHIKEGNHFCKILQICKNCLIVKNSSTLNTTAGISKLLNYRTKRLYFFYQNCWTAPPPLPPRQSNRKSLIIAGWVGGGVSSRSINLGEGGQETWNISRHTRRPSFLRLFFTGQVWGHGLHDPPPLICYWAEGASCNQVYIRPCSEMALWLFSCFKMYYTSLLIVMLQWSITYG